MVSIICTGFNNTSSAIMKKEIEKSNLKYSKTIYTKIQRDKIAQRYTELALKNGYGLRDFSIDYLIVKNYKENDFKPIKYVPLILTQRDQPRFRLKSGVIIDII